MIALSLGKMPSTQGWRIQGDVRVTALWPALLPAAIAVSTSLNWGFAAIGAEGCSGLSLVQGLYDLGHQLTGGRILAALS